MRFRKFHLVPAVALLLATSVTSASVAVEQSIAGALPGNATEQGTLDGTFAILATRAEAPAEAISVDPSLSPRGVPPSPERLFFMTAVDNATCIRAIPDVTGDGKQEIVVGIDESGVDNVFCLDSASSGAATTVWSLETMGGLSGGSPWGEQSIEPASDADGNTFPNVLVATAWGGRTAYEVDAQAGAIQWQFDTYLTPDSGWVYSLAELNDLNGDGVREVAFGVGSDSDSVYVVDGASAAGVQATEVWRYPAADAVLSVRDLGDVNGDGYHDVLAGIGDFGDQVVCLSGDPAAPTRVLWSYPTPASAYAVAVMPDITGDGVNEAIALLWITSGAGSNVRLLNGATGALIWESISVAVRAVSADILDDVTGDGIPEVLVGSFQNAAVALDGADGSPLWKTTVGTTNGGDVWTIRAIDDLNGDGRQDVVAGSFDYHVYALDGIDGAVIWAYNTNNRVFSVYPVDDLDGDGQPEVAVATQDTNTSEVVHVLSAGTAPAEIFTDGFESGDTSAWSNAVP